MRARQSNETCAALLWAVAAVWLLGACSDQQEEAVNELYQSDYAFTVEDFFRAASVGDLQAVRWFIGAGMDPAVADVSKSQALHFAAGAGQAEVVAELLGLGVDPATERRDGRTPLMLAAESGDGRSVELLLDAGASAEGKDSSGWSALALAAYGGFGRAVEALVPFSRAYLNDALLLAAMGGHVSSMDHLVSGTATVDVRSPVERTPLMLAASRGHRDAVKFLLHHGANWYAIDLESQTASQMAAAGGHGEIVNLLESAHLEDAVRGGGDDRFVPEKAAGEALLYSSLTRRIDGESLVDTTGSADDLRGAIQLLNYRERQLPIQFEGAVDEDSGAAEVRLLFGDSETFLVRQGEVIPQTHLEVVAVEVNWSQGKEGQGAPVRVARLVVRDLVSGEVIGVTPGDPSRSARSFCLVKHTGTGQIYEVRRGDRFKALGGQFRVMDMRPMELLVEELASGAVVRLEI